MESSNLLQHIDLMKSIPWGDAARIGRVELSSENGGRIPDGAEQKQDQNRIAQHKYRLSSIYGVGSTFLLTMRQFKSSTNN